jgi:hypothetical protein
LVDTGVFRLTFVAAIGQIRAYNAQIKETTMADNGASQVQQNPFKTLADEQIARMEAVNEELAKLQQKTLAQVQASGTEAIKMWAASFEYGAQLAADFRKLALDATKQSFAFATSTTKL